MSKLSRLAFAFLIVLILLSGLALAQSKETGAVQGKVSDEAGAPLPGVNVIATSPNLMGTRTAVTDQEGKYRLAALPTGTYAIEASLQGFGTAKRTGVIVHVGTTGTIDIAMTPAKIEMAVSVVGEAPPIDITDASLGKTYLGKDFLDNIPTARDTFRIINSVPGITGLSAYGSGDHTGNLYQLDGVELTDSWFGGGIYSAAIDYDIIEETQVVALGAPAEYGNFTGATVNMVTKSGGNSLSGDVKFFLRGKNWQSNNIDKSKPEWSVLTETPLTETYDAGFHLGGPILKDKLWFFGGYNYFKSTIEMASVNKSSPLTYPKAFIKFTYQPDEKNRISALFEYHKSTQKNMTQSPLVPDEANYKFVYPVYIGNVSFLHIFSSQTIFELKIAGNNMVNDYIPNSGPDVAGHVDLVTGVSSFNNPWRGHWTSERYTLSSALTHNVENFIKGSHDLKFGIEVEKAVGGGYSQPTGEVTYYDWNGQPYIASSWGFKSWGVNWRYTAYAQDDWRLSDALVLNPGLRFSMIRGSVPDLGRTVYKPNNLEPRIGLVWDIAKDHKTVVKAHVGRYFEGSKSYYFSNMQPNPDSVSYSVGPNWSSLTETYRTSGASLYSIDPNIKHPSMDQAVAGVERVLGKDITMSVSFIYRFWKNFIESVNTTAVFEKLPFTDPGTGEVFTVYNQINPGQDKFFITNPKVGVDYGAAYPEIVQVDPYRKYRAVELAFNKRLSDNWQFSASYVYSKEWGTYGNSHAGDVQRSWMGHQSWNMGGASVYKDPNNQINLYGNSIISAPHVFKAHATYMFPLDFSLSAFYTYTSGRRWERNVVISGINQWGVYLMTEPRGSRSLPAANSLDMRLDKSFRFDKFRFSIVLDMFNVFNQARMTEVIDTYGVNLGKALNVNTPRSFRLNFNLAF